MQESPLKSSLSSQVPQASEGDVSQGTDRLDCCRKDEHHPFEDAESSRDMRIGPPEGDIALLDHLRRLLQARRERRDHRCLSLKKLT